MTSYARPTCTPEIGVSRARQVSWGDSFEKLRDLTRSPVLGEHSVTVLASSHRDFSGERPASDDPSLRFHPLSERPNMILAGGWADQVSEANFTLSYVLHVGFGVTVLPSFRVSGADNPLLVISALPVGSRFYPAEVYCKGRLSKYLAGLPDLPRVHALYQIRTEIHSPSSQIIRSPPPPKRGTFRR